ncbi:hypothetical protein [Spiroplasma endosymbiont of Tricholauxania praeusta]|uniref:hypothetical protein n=1 Tax=Spiroplasma endosymbiont of Tricholauxania praeusta TaxID=3066296 RepID=UPI0030D3B806
MNKEKLIISMKERIDLLNNSLREYSSKLYELEDLKEVNLTNDNITYFVWK